MSESLRNDGRIWVPKQIDDTRSPDQIPEDDRDYFLERRYPAFGNLVAARRRVARDQARGRRGPRRRAAEERRVPRLRRRDRAARPATSIEERYGNLFEMYERITGEDPYDVPMRIYPAVHYTMGGLWVDYNLMSNVPGLFVLGEANFSDHGANRLGASALMQGLADGYFVLPYTIGDYLAPLLGEHAGADRRPRVQGRRARRSTSRCARCCRSTATAPSTTSTASSARSCGTTAAWRAPSRASRRRCRRSPRSARSSGRTCACSARTRRATSRSRRPGASPTSSSSASCMVLDALHRNESCGGHFREEYQTEEGEALRDDEHFAYVAAWEFKGVGNEPELHKEAARVRVRPPVDPVVQVERTHRWPRTRCASRSRSGARPGPTRAGAFETYDVPGVSPDMSFLEMLDIVNERLMLDGKEPIAFDHDCREGICGSCGLMINGSAARPERGTATCQLHMRKFTRRRPRHDRAVARRELPARQDLIVDRSAFDRIIESGGYISVGTGGAPDGNLIPIPKAVADAAMDAAACIGCGACVAACPNGAAQLFTVGEAAAPQPAAAGPGRALGPHGRHGRDDGDVLRLVHEPPRVRGRVPEVDLDRLHRADEPRLRQGAAQAAPPRRPDASRRRDRGRDRAQVAARGRADSRRGARRRSMTALTVRSSRERRVPAEVATRPLIRDRGRSAEHGVAASRRDAEHLGRTLTQLGLPRLASTRDLGRVGRLVDRTVPRRSNSKCFAANVK